jgi:hypothetical protein
MEEDIVEIINNLPCDMLYLPEKKTPLETFIIGSTADIFNPSSEKWFIFFTNEKVRKYYEGTDPLFPNTDWYNILMRNWAPQQQYNLSVRGGSEKIKYYGFIGYTDQETMIKKNGGNYRRYNLQSNIDAKITDNFSFQLDIAGIHEERNSTARILSNN